MKMWTLPTLLGLALWTGGAKADQLPPSILIDPIDERPITDVSLTVTAYVEGSPIKDFEYVGALNRQKTLVLNAWGGVWSNAAGAWVGDFLRMTNAGSAAQGNSPLLIRQTDGRPFTDVCVEITFKVDGAPAYDWECVDVVDAYHRFTFLELTGWGGHWNAQQQRWEGNFLFQD